MRRQVCLAVALLLSIIVACGPGGASHQRAGATASPTTTAASVPAAATAVGPTNTPEPGADVEWRHYHDPVLGFAVDYPAGWEVHQETTPGWQGLAWVWFYSHLHPYGVQYKYQYTVGVTVKDSEGRTLDEAGAFGLTGGEPADSIRIHCCLVVGGEQAIERYSSLPAMGERQVVVLHEGREYHIHLLPQASLGGGSEEDMQARMAFDSFLRTFAFVPVTRAPPGPLLTPVPTPP